MRTKSTNSAIFPILFGFFVMGFVDVVGIATNYVKMDFGLSDTLANLLPMMVFLWFALFSVPTGIWMGRHGRRNTVVAALAITTLAMLIPLFFYDFACILFAFALLGIGNTILQVSLNPMVARVVNPDKVTSVLTLGQFIKAVSSFLGPIIAGVASSFWGDWKLIFIVYSVTTLLSIIWLIATIPGKEEGEEQEASFASTLALCKDARIRMLFLGILCIVGIDVGLNTTIPKLLMEKLSMPLQEAGLGSSLYFAARTGGSFLGAILLARISSRPFLRGSMLIAILAFIGLLISDSLWSMGVMIVLVGLACSNVFSILFSFALEHRPEQSNEVSALMIMGVSGGALITPCMGGIADMFGQVAGLMLLLICMLYSKYSINSLVYWVTYVHNVVYSFYRSMIYCYINSTQRCAGSIVIDIIPTNGADKRKFFPFAPYFPVTNVIKRYFYPYFPAIIGIKGYSFPYFPYLSGIMKIKTALYSLFSRLDWHKTVVFPCLGEIYEGIRSLSWEIPVT